MVPLDIITLTPEEYDNRTALAAEYASKAKSFTPAERPGSKHALIFYRSRPLVIPPSRADNEDRMS
jgi:hypothetical protein